MPSKQIHELPSTGTLASDDHIVVSTAASAETRRARLVDLPITVSGPGATSRRLVDKIAEQIAVTDFGAIGDGIHDDAPAFQAAADAHETIIVPHGTYRLASPVALKPRRRIIGAGRDASEVVAQGDFAFIVHRNSGGTVVEPAAAGDWNRGTIASLTIRMAKGGIRVFGHEFRASDLNFFGGAAPAGEADETGWCIDLIDANECQLTGINAGYGGGVAHQLKANGIRWRASTSGVNYGDSLVTETSIKLGAVNTTGLLLDGHQADASALINNMVLQRIQVNAPQGGQGLAPLAGTTGIKLWNAARICLIDCDVEVLATAFEEYSESLGGQAGACVANTFIGCIAHWSDVHYRDSNATFGRSVIQRNFVGCDNVAPLPTGVHPDDEGRCQDGDAFLQGAWLVNKFGEPSIQMRSHDKDVLLLTGDYKGSAQALADGHPSSATPYKGLLVELTSKQSAKITRAVAHGVADPDDDAAVLHDVRLELGNGEGDARGELARVQINDPLLLRARTSEPLRPYNGLLHHATAPSALPATGEWYLGPGLYCRLNDGEYPPVAVQRGALPERERNNSFTVSPADFGKLHRINHGSERTVTIPAGLVAQNAGARRFWVVRQGSGGVRFAAEAGVALRSAGGRATISRQYQMVEVVVTDTDDVYLHHILPDAIEPFEEKLHWTNGNLVMPSYHVGKLIRISNNNPSFIEIPTGLVPETMEAVSFRLCKIADGDVEVRAGSDMTLLSPTGIAPYTITTKYKVVEIVVSGPNETQPNTIYIVD